MHRPDAPLGVAVHNRPMLALATGVLLAGMLLPFVAHAPNRLVSGVALQLWQVPDVWSCVALIPALPLMMGAFLRQTEMVLWGLLAAAIVLPAGLTHVAAVSAEALSLSADSKSARTSLGSGFWVMILATALMIPDLTARMGLSPKVRLFVSCVAIAPLAAMVLLGHLDAMSIMKEYTNKAALFHAALIRHFVIVLGALVPTLLLGVPLGIFAFRRPAFGGPVLAGLNIIQTVPSIALFGLLMAPLSALAARVPLLQSIGISGIGLAPAIIALTLYAMLPIVRNTYQGLGEVPPQVVEAARGVGMTPTQVFWHVELPLALPVFLAGLRVTVVQAIGLAAVAALIGAGGLGSIMFQGLFANALDLVLLGALPIIGIAVAADAIFNFALISLQRTKT